MQNRHRKNSQTEILCAKMNGKVPIIAILYAWYL